MPDSQMPLPPAPPHNNQQLFSDYYLNEILPNRAEWRLLTERAEEAMQEIAGLFTRYVPSEKEAQVEADLIRPILKALGHDFEVQPSLKVPGGAQTPDYVFYRDKSALNANKGKILTDALPHEGGFAVGDAKHWDRPLDTVLKSKSGDPFSNKNPSYQIAFYIQHSGVDWGILTNGRLWRLYHKDTAHKLDRFYEVDLPGLLQEGDAARFLYFYAFFRRAAFDARPLGVSEILRASVDYARGVGDTLKGQVYEALLHIAQGFLDYAPNKLQPDTETLQTLYDNALIVLYRLLFILYAEDRELLPVRENDSYRHAFSLRKIKQDVARNLHYGDTLPTSTGLLWPRLKELFRIIDQGSPPLQVATFNGGLFDPKRHPFLEQVTIGDARLQRALDKLARVDGQLVDYRDLSVRHLGTIYEGLLEYHLEAAAPEEGFTLKLLNDKGERKATGSYYTPDTIVKFMVERTVGPALREAVAGKADDAARVEAALSLNVLDPAMGSGHFLVEAAEYIARFLVDLAVLPGADAEGEPDLLYWKRRVAQSCIYGVDVNPLAVELAKLSLWLTTVAKDRPLSFLDHHLRPGNALVGARLDHLQLAAKKAKGKSKAEQAEAKGQLSMLDDDAFRQSMSQAVSNLWLIEFRDARSVADVKEQERLYESLRETLTMRYGRLADLVTATYFGLQVDSALWKPLTDYAVGRTMATLPQLEQWLDTSAQIAAQRRFFHWELEFPEVFFDRHGRPLGEQAGFDAVIGNPPYVRQEQLAPYKPFFQARFAAFHGVADLYLYFYEQGITLARTGGRMAYISSGTFARANFAVEFRKLLPTVAQIDCLIDYGENQPFEGAEMVRPSIVILTKSAQQRPFRALFIAGKVPASLEEALQTEGIDCDVAALQQPEWTFQPAGNTRLFQKILGAGCRLIDAVDEKMYRGVLTGLNEAFLIDRPTRDRLVASDPSCAPILKPIVRGEDLRPWYQEDEGRFLIFTRRGVNIDAYPAIKDYLSQFRTQLEPRPADWNERQPWPGRKPGAYHWYEIQDTVDYYKSFEEPKIFWPDIAKLPRFSWAEAGIYIGNTGYLIPAPDLSLLGILQSRVAWFAISQICQPLRLRAGLWQYRVLPQFISRLPIPDLTSPQREAIGGLAMAITQQARARYDLHCKAHHRLLADLVAPGGSLNQKLTAWWDFDFPALRAELKKAFKRDVPVGERDEWETWLAARRAEHAQHTQEIVRLETELNAHVYALFDLTPAEIQLIEESTKYRYGEV